MAQKKKKYPQRQYRSPEEKVKIIARAQEIGITAAGREAGVGSSVVSRWAQAAGVVVPIFRFNKKDGVVRVGEGVPKNVDKSPRGGPDSWSRQSEFSHEQRLAIIREAFASGNTAATARQHGIKPHTMHNWVVRYGGEARASGNPEPRQVEMTPPPGHRVEDDIREALSSTGTQLSRPGPSEALALDTPRRGRRPKSARAEQLPLYQEPQPVQAHPVYDEAERAREQAQSELKDSLLRQALKEREAFKTVMEIMMREKNER